MPERVIRGRRVEPDRWTLVTESDGPWPEGPIIVPLAAWKARGAERSARAAPVGVWLAPADDPAEIAAELTRIAIVAVQFPKFTDGRGYSTAALLRGLHGYRGELRAFGDVGRDQLHYLARVGFDSFRLPGHRDPDAALAAFDEQRVHYQGAVDDPRPLFRRREAGHG